MRPFRKNVALAVDGGGIRGVIVTRALAILEEHLSLPVNSIFRLAAGTSTGSIISAGVAAGLTARQMNQLYIEQGPVLFKKSWRTVFWPLLPYRYPSRPLESSLQKYLGDLKMGDFWTSNPQTDVVITTFDLQTNHTRFIKPWKSEYKNWPVVKAVMASSTVPTYFPVVDGRFVDGGVGAYANPCYLAAYELRFCLDWDPAETTLVSLGTGRDPHFFDPAQADHLRSWQWIVPILGAFLQSADDQQVQLVNTFFSRLDFRRFQVDLEEHIAMDDASKIPLLERYGEELGNKLLNDKIDPAQNVIAAKAPGMFAI